MCSPPTGSVFFPPSPLFPCSQRSFHPEYLLVIYLSGCAGSSLLWRLSSSRGKWGPSAVAACRLLLRWLLLLWSTGSRRTGSAAATRRLQRTGSADVVHRLSCSSAWGIFPDPGSKPVSHTGRQSLYHWATREACHLSIPNQKCCFLPKVFPAYSGWKEISCLLIAIETRSYLFISQHDTHLTQSLWTLQLLTRYSSNRKKK